MKARGWKIALAWLLLPLTSVHAEPTAGTPPAASISVNIIGPGLRSTDLDRSIKFYTKGLGMVMAYKLVHGSVTEVMLSFNSNRTPPIILLFKDEAPGKSPPIEHGNGFGRVILSVADAEALSIRLSAAGYTAGELHTDAATHTRVFWAEDPDGYKYEITQLPKPET